MATPTPVGVRVNLARAAAAFATSKGAHPDHVAHFAQVYLAWTDTGLQLTIRTAWAAYAALVEHQRAKNPQPGYRR